MNPDPVVSEVTVNAPKSKVWHALTDKAEMKKWYFDLSEFKAEKGFKFQFTGGTEEKQYLHLCEVTNVVFESKLTHTWTYDNVPVETFVTWELTSIDDNKTSVKLTHKGVDDFPADNKDFARSNFVAGWDHIVKTALKEHVEK